MDYHWNVSTWNGLSREDFHDFLQLRVNVFVVEQDCPYPELDNKDREAIHVWTRNASNEVIAYLRILPPGVSYYEPAIGRVVVREDCRSSGAGAALMKEGIEICKSRYENRDIRISAQEHLTKFYGSLGFEVCSEMYLEDDIPHVEMLYQNERKIG